MLPREQPGTRFETHAATLGVIKIRKIRRIHVGAAVITPCRGVHHVVETPFPAIPLGFFPDKHGSASVTITVRGSIRIYREWEKIQRGVEPKYVG